MLGELFDDASEAISRSAPQLQREDYPHVDARRTVRSIHYVPLINGEDLIGAVEILCFGDVAATDALKTLVEVSEAGCGFARVRAAI